MDEFVLQLKDITKIFPHPETPVVANDKVSLNLKKGEVLAVVGENGTGKSTLMNILYGLLPMDEGEIYLKGKKVSFKNSRDAISHKIGMVHQHFMLIPSFTASENLVFTYEPVKNGVFVDLEKARRITREISERYGLYVDPDKKISECPLSMQQRVEILKLLYHEAEILIFDEPTAVLTPSETDELFKAFEQLKKDGKSIIFISHKLLEVTKVSDRITIMRKGKVVETVENKDVSISFIAEKMVGRRVDVNVRKEGLLPPDKAGEGILEVKGLSTRQSSSGTALKNVSFTVREGEILGVAGVGGNGQEDIVKCVNGLSDLIESGGIVYLNTDITGFAANKVRRLGIAHITGERYKMGISLDSDIYENVIMGVHRRAEFSGRLFMKIKELKAYVERLVKTFSIKASSIYTPIMNLSGGNIQKCILARELSLAKKLVIAEEPTRGVDIGSIEFIHDELVKISGEGFGILLVSTDLEEILSLSTRVIVVFNGEIAGEVYPEEDDARKKIGLLMAGIKTCGEGEAV